MANINSTVARVPSFYSGRIARNVQKSVGVRSDFGSIFGLCSQSIMEMIDTHSERDQSTRMVWYKLLRELKGWVSLVGPLGIVAA
jgi:hypothetical protein